MNNNFTSLNARSRAQVDDMISAENGFLVMFYNNDCVAEIAEAEKCFKKAFVVTLVQTDRGFVQDIGHSYQPGPDL